MPFSLSENSKHDICHTYKRKTMKTIGIIPARYASTRLPGKPLRMIAGKSMISRVYERVALAGLDEIYVATDDERIYKHVIAFGGKAIMTSTTIGGGTERCYAAISHTAVSPEDIIINIQGDEPFIEPENIRKLIAVFTHTGIGIATLFAHISEIRELFDTGIPKLVTDKSGRVLYFSRYPIPCIRDHAGMPQIDDFPFKKHIGIYAYRLSELAEISSLPSSELEHAEKLEQLRWLEHGKTIYATEVNDSGISVDTPEDLERAEKYALQFSGNQKG